jgi:uncharacterized membrane protein
MAGGGLVIGILLILLGLVAGIYTAFPVIAPEGTWGREAVLGGRWWLGLVALLLMAGGTLVLRRDRRRGRGSPDTFLTPAEETKVLEAIAEFERRTSGEIRVHLAASAGADIMATARRVFEKLGMTATQERNGVLFFVAVEKHRFAVIGDAGIDQVVPDGFWDVVVDHVRERFRAQDVAGGLITGIHMAGKALAEHFPVAPDDVNELPDEISRE